MLSFNAHSACSPASGSIGLDGTVKSQPKCFENVMNVDSELISIGAVAILSVVSDNGVTVVRGATTAGTIPYCVMTEVCSASEKNCKCQTKGFNDVVLFDGVTTATAGELVFISEATSGRVQATAKGSIAASDFPLGIFLDASSAAGAIEVVLDL